MNERLIQLRSNLNLTQAEFAEKLNLTRAAISNYEVGRRPLTERTIADVCRIFNVNEIWLRAGEGAMYRIPSDINNELISEIYKLINSNDEFSKDLILKYLKLSTFKKEEIKGFINHMSKYKK